VTPKLLLADDSVTIQRVIELTFADEDVQVLAVGDGRQAIERVQSDRPDIVLADIGMPERDGYEVAAFIKADPQLAHIPVLLLTGAFEPVDEVRARAVGCDGVLVKPFEPQMVISRVRDLLAGIRTAEPPLDRPAYMAPPIGPTAAGGAERPQAANESPGAALEDYFDRLDAALASKTVPPPPHYAELTPVPFPGPPAPAPAPVMRPVPVPPQAARASAPPPPPAGPAASVETPAAEDTRSTGVDFAGWDPPPLAASVQPIPPPQTPQVHVATPPPAPAPQPVPEPTVSAPTLQEAFAALLSAEQSQPITIVPGPPVDPDSTVLIDEIARRVIARLGDDSMRAAVLDAAERLVREEIARIKNQK
jgi:CheY-like chemotaxis protein